MTSPGIIHPSPWGLLGLSVHSHDPLVLVCLGTDGVSSSSPVPATALELCVSCSLWLDAALGSAEEGSW